MKSAISLSLSLLALFYAAKMSRSNALVDAHIVSAEIESLPYIPEVHSR